MNEGYSICLNEWALDKDIKNELGLLLIISSLCAEKGFCFASNSYLANIFHITEISVSMKLKKLEKKEYIKIKYEYRGCQVVSREIRLKNILTEDYKKIEPTIKNNFKDNNISINNKKEILKEKKLKFIEIINNSDLINELKEVLITWLNYKEEINDLYKSTIGFEKLISQIRNQLKEHSDEEIINVINSSMASNYKGIIFDRLNKNPRKTNSYTPTTVNDDGVYRIL